MQRLLWSSWPRRVYVLLTAAYAMVLIPVATYLERTPENLTQFAAVSTCVLTLFTGLWQRDRIQRLWSRLRWSPGK